MASHPYTTVPGRIAELLEKIRSVGIPEKATGNWLKLIGLKSSNDRTLITVLKYIGFVNSRGEPSDLWRLYRGADHAVVLANALRESYATIFQTFEAPCRLNTNELKDFFRVNMGAAEGTIAKMVDTFKALCQLSDFRQDKIGNIELPGRTMPKNEYTHPQKRPVSVKIDVQLPLTDNEEVYEKIFRAMRKYLLD